MLGAFLKVLGSILEIDLTQIISTQIKRSHRSV